LDFAAAAAFALVGVTADELELEAVTVVDATGAAYVDAGTEFEIELVDCEVSVEDEELLTFADVVFLLDEDVELEVPFVDEIEVLFELLNVVFEIGLVTLLDVALAFPNDVELLSYGSITDFIGFITVIFEGILLTKT
jgi:hypothetical protein